MVNEYLICDRHFEFEPWHHLVLQAPPGMISIKKIKTRRAGNVTLFTVKGRAKHRLQYVVDALVMLHFPYFCFSLILKKRLLKSCLYIGSI